MPIIRSKTRRFFSAVDSAVIRNTMLSLPALGLLITLLDRSDGWVFRPFEIARSVGVGQDALNPILRELLDSGFLRERRDRYGVCYDLYELPPAGFSRHHSFEALDRGETQTPPDLPSDPPESANVPPEKSEPMSDERLAYWLNVIREKFPKNSSA